MYSYKDFTDKVLKRGSKRHKISHCVGVKEAWRNARKNKYHLLGGVPCSYTSYVTAVKAANKLLVEKLLEGHTVKFPYQLGSLKLTSKKAGVKAEEGVVKDNYCVDWKATLEYWYEDPEAMQNKVRIKRIRKKKLVISYHKDPLFKNYSYYRFRANRSLVKSLGKVAEGKLIK